MHNRIRTKLGMLAAVAVLGVAPSALAEPHQDGHHEGKANDPHEGKSDEHRKDHEHGPAASASGLAGEAPSAGAPTGIPPAKARFLERLHKLEEEREKDRKSAVKD